MCSDDLVRFADYLAQARKGDVATLGNLLEGYRNYLALLARLQIGRRLQGKMDPVDLVQDTFLEAHRDFPHFRGQSEGELVSWLRRILVRNLANALRHYFGTQGRDIRLERELSAEIDQSSQVLDRGLIAPISSPSQQASHREQVVLLADALGRLQEDYREAIILRHLEGLTFPEVALRLGRSVDSVEKLWARGLVQLREMLKAPP
ncbi:MAG TPA: sigma-70 family RNA polymerase sigma factor [Gemmataceae bacterium]|jgi:RNA polymerase sigma-70 factor (ECF subfamily)|nr:sigma-70 family RNA polymerase sigma factor [Gemmataceae bacterium]